MLSDSLDRMIWALLIAFALTMVLGPQVIKWLTKLKVGQNVYELAPEEHQKKQGTPTMGGLMFAAISIIAAFALRRGPFSLASDLLLALCVFALLNLGLGFADDFTKLRGHKNQGLTERQKLIVQCVVALLFSLYCYLHPMIGSKIIVPFFGWEWDLGPFYIPAMIFVIVCTTNGANFLDGLDGLAGGVTSVITSFFSVVVILMLNCMHCAATSAITSETYRNLQNVGVLMAAVTGALLGYLRFNLYPARLMMGDTGSMYLGGLVVGVAMITRLPLLIPIAAAGYAVSLLSTFIQRWYFRLTKGKRIFKMAPLHHHFELSGMHETAIVGMYVIFTVVLCVLSLLSLKGIYF